MLVHVHINILDNINLADVANEFVDRKDSRKQKFGHFFRVIHNICKIKLTPSSFSYIYYISYQMWSCATFYHLLNRFPQPNDNCISPS